MRDREEWIFTEVVIQYIYMKFHWNSHTLTAIVTVTAHIEIYHWNSNILTAIATITTHIKIDR